MRFAITVAAIPLCAEYYPGVHMQALPSTAPAISAQLLKIINFFTRGLLYVALDTWLVLTVANMYPEALAVDSFWWAIAIAGSVNIARMLIDILTRDFKKH